VASRKKPGRIWLVCDDCGSEFPGDVTYSIVKLSEETGETRTELDHIQTPCPRDPTPHAPSHRNIRPRDA
jgi:hypothetical protein